LDPRIPDRVRPPFALDSNPLLRRLGDNVDALISAPAGQGDPISQPAVQLGNVSLELEPTQGAEPV
jgi:hypothetical protein